MTYTREKVEGLTELKAALEGLGTEVSTKIGIAADRGAAKVFRDRLVAAAPYSTRSTRKYWKRKNGSVGQADYGHLRDNLRVKKLRSQKENLVVYAVTVGRAFWGRFVEVGTAKMGARPWFQPAFDAATGDLVDEQVDALRDGIDRAARRLARIRKKGG